MLWNCRSKRKKLSKNTSQHGNGCLRGGIMHQTTTISVIRFLFLFGTNRIRSIDLDHGDVMDVDEEVNLYSSIHDKDTSQTPTCSEEVSLLHTSIAATLKF